MLLILIPDFDIYRLLHMDASLKNISTVSFGMHVQFVTFKLQTRLLLR